MNYTFLALGATLILFLTLLLFLELGRRVGARRIAQDPKGAREGVGVMEGAIFALLGLLIAFTFGGAASRFDTRRQLIVEEANAIGTAYLRLDLLPANLQPDLRDKFRTYVDARLEVYRKLPDIAAAKAELARAANLQKEIWSQAVAAVQTPEGERARMLLLPALNNMIDITTTRTMAGQTHPPLAVFAMLIALALAGSLLAGHAMAASGTRSWMHMVGFSASLAIAVYVIVDLEFPRFGLIRVDAFDQAIVDARETMK